ncbi:formate dehydrogenase iron-sulfur subunit [Faunimonas pinastri]|uniref:Formate dehydrogenase iron-sulfur subunit n=1 Tax=Faunimonas pinastri TaxID=1855383 RepID=A0A1H9A7W7_9HYPH|nr:4Fe-4S dicluster domain-containing protein [Faunimonas pinastri]SEP72725.1 formate dehydrogenase iron-sulfur subunit [Faunimonas pinastri]
MTEAWDTAKPWISKSAGMIEGSLHPRVLDYTDSFIDEVIPNESELTAGVTIEPGKSYGFFTDTTLCIGCKACEVACKEWNQLPAEEQGMSGMSYDNTRGLSSSTWRHVTFVEKVDREHTDDMQPFQSNWLMMSDVCKHCANAPCLEACPTGALFRTEFDTVVVQQDICNGCGYCVPACPFGVVDLDMSDGKAHKCTLCYDRLKGGLEPACAKSCPTDSIQFGEWDDLYERAQERVEDLHERGATNAYLYGTPGAPGATGGLERLQAFFLLSDRPEVYGLPAAPTRPSRRVAPALGTGLATAASLALAAIFLFSGKRR